MWILCGGWAVLLTAMEFSLAYSSVIVQPMVLQELWTVNGRFRVRGPTPPPPQIILVLIDEDSMGALFDEEEKAAEPELALLDKWPFHRSAYALVLDRLFSAGAKVVGMDLFFPSKGEGDDSLKEAIRKYRDRIVIGSNFDDEGKRLQRPSDVIPEGVPTDSVAGYVNYWPDIDDFDRRARYQAYEWMIAGIDRDPNMPLLLSFDAMVAKKYDHVTPLPGPEEYPYVNFFGPPGTFPSVDFYQILHDRSWERNLKSGEIFRDKIVLIGPSGNVFHDYAQTPFAETTVNQMPGVEVHANAIATLLTGTDLRDAPRGIGAAAILFMALATGFILQAKLHPLLKVALLALLAGGYFFAAYEVFLRMRVVMIIASPMLVVVGAGVTGITLQLIAEQLEKRRVRQTLEKYVSKPVADEILKHGNEFEQSLGGERKRVTILFSDVRGFTTMSEQLSPVEFVAQLNEYFTEMVDCVMKHDGTLDKFIGDAIMAVWGAPLGHDPKEEAWRAVQSAYEMRERLAILQKRWNELGKPPINIGIGINHGEVVVGNIGSLQRMEYTVIGDPVNVASRVEGLNKEFKTDILLTESVYELVKERVEVEAKGEIAVKGRAKKVGIYYLKRLVGVEPGGSMANPSLPSTAQSSSLPSTSEKMDKLK